MNTPKMPTSENLRSLFDESDVVEAFKSPSKFSMLPSYLSLVTGKNKWIKWISEDSAIDSLNVLCWRMNGEMWLVRLGPKGGITKLWSFGKVV